MSAIINKVKSNFLLLNLCDRFNYSLAVLALNFLINKMTLKTLLLNH